MPDNLVIRPAMAHDLGGLITLYQHLNSADPALDGATAEERFSAILAQPGMTVFIGFAGTLAAATFTLIVIPNLTRGGASYALLSSPMPIIVSAAMPAPSSATRWKRPGKPAATR